jgi:hypothetical protein
MGRPCPNPQYAAELHSATSVLKPSLHPIEEKLMAESEPYPTFTKDVDGAIGKRSKEPTDEPSPVDVSDEEWKGKLLRLRFLLDLLAQELRTNK